MTTQRIRRTLTVALCIALASSSFLGCLERVDVYNQPMNVTGPIVVGRHLAYMDMTRDRIFLVQPTNREVLSFDVGRRPSFMIPSPDHSQLFVLSKGWIATNKDEEDEEASLTVIDPATQNLQTFELASPFDEVAISDDNRYAIAYFSAHVTPSDTEVFRNPNSIAIVDLETGTVTEKNVRSFGAVPQGVIFSPSEMAPLAADGTPGTPRTLAVVFAQGSITLLDVTQSDRREITIRLSLPGMEADIMPQKMVFAPSAGVAYLTASGINDVYVINLTEDLSATFPDNDFVVSINVLVAGSSPGDIALFTDGSEPRILVANQGSSDLTVIDATTAQYVTIPVGTPVDRILTYPEDDPQMALIFSQGSPNQQIHFLDLPGVWENLRSALTTLEGAQPVIGIELIPNQPRALVVHDNQRAVISVLDFSDRTLFPFSSHNMLSNYAITSDGGVLGGVSPSRNQVGIVDLNTLSSRAIMLEHHPSSVFTLDVGPGNPGDAELRSIVISHDVPYGSITVLPDPLTNSAENTFTFEGFLLSNIFDDRFED